MAEQFKCGKTQIQGILLKKDEIVKDYEANVSSSIKRSRGAQRENINNVLLDWFRKARSKKSPSLLANLKNQDVLEVSKIEMPYHASISTNLKPGSRVVS